MRSKKNSVCLKVCLFGGLEIGISDHLSRSEIKPTSWKTCFLLEAFEPSYVRNTS